MVGHSIGACGNGVTSEAVKRPDHIICCVECDIEGLGIRASEGSRCVKIDETRSKDRSCRGEDSLISFDCRLLLSG